VKTTDTRDQRNVMSYHFSIEYGVDIESVVAIDRGLVKIPNF